MSEGKREPIADCLKKADARLVAAAPEMYKLIEQLAFRSCDDCFLVMVAGRKLLASIDGTEEASHN